MKPTVAVALSGGTDSAIAALVLQSAGHKVVGIHFILNEDAFAASQRQRAEEVARHLGIALHVHDAIELFKSLIVTPSRAEYCAGRTPNPCVTCNRVVKFGALLEHSRALGADLMATGHYARVEAMSGRYSLLRATDRHADQSYFLYSIKPDILRHILFPLGTMARSEVHAIADREGFAAFKPSQDICFQVRPEREELQGDVVDIEGHIVGHHRGLESFTIGQRRGLGIATGKPLYIVRIDAEQNRVVVGGDEDLVCNAALLREATWFSGSPPSPQQAVQAKARYRARATPARVVTNEDGAAGVLFDEPQRAVAPGQSIVLYDGEVVLGGGIVAETYGGRRVEI